MNNVPISTKMTLDAVGAAGRLAVSSVFMVYCAKTQSKGTGFLLNNGWVITNEHVIHDCAATDILLISSFGQQLRIKELKLESAYDLAAMQLATPISGGLTLDTAGPPEIGSAVTTWGFPLGYNGPSPLLSVGYLAGFEAWGTQNPQLVVNGAFNPGNSGGPLFRSGDDKVIGVVVSKHVPFQKFHMDAIQVLANNQSGIVFTGTDGNGKPIQFVESQLVAELLTYFRSLTQVMLGEAISATSLEGFLQKVGI